jgi:hypothetical protein
MKSGFDINRISGDGYLILPLSMSRLETGQSPKFCYEVLESFESKLETFSNDVILLYTNGLYFNSEEVSFENRKRTTQQALNHIQALRNLVEKKRKFMPGAIHYLPCDYIIFNSPNYQEYFARLKKLEAEDPKFREMLIADSKDQRYTEANSNFIIEELVFTHVIRLGLVDLPRTLVKTDAWRLIAYPGRTLRSDVYQWKQGILPKKKDATNPYAGAQYDLAERKLYVFDEMETGD